MINQSFTCCTLGKLSLGEFSLRKGKFWWLEQTKLARIIGLGNVNARISLAKSHMWACSQATGNLEAATNTTRFSRIRPVGCFLVMGKLVLDSYCYVVQILFSVFLIFCITSFCDCTRPQHKETTDLRHTTDQIWNRFPAFWLALIFMAWNSIKLKMKSC